MPAEDMCFNSTQFIGFSLPFIRFPPFQNDIFSYPDTIPHDYFLNPRGNSFHSRPSKALSCVAWLLPSCLMKKGISCPFTSSLTDATQLKSIGVAPFPVSEPTTTHSTGRNRLRVTGPSRARSLLFVSLGF